MATERRFVFIFSLLSSLLVALARTPSEVVRSFARLSLWPDFKPDAAASLALDHLNRVDVATMHSPEAPRFKAFHDRALTHLGWYGGVYEPSRLVA